ncbi:MAG: hypothetical protein ABWK05_01695 [Pyrobaculum sp.]
MLQIVDYDEMPHVLYDVDVVVSPRCRAPPPAPSLDAAFVLAKIFKKLYGASLYTWLADQKDLGLSYVDPVLLYAQLPLEESWAARVVPHGGALYKCVLSWPDPVTAAVAVASRGARSLAVDARHWRIGLEILAEYAEAMGVDLQLVVTEPLSLPGDVVFHSSVPPHLRERFIKAPGDVSIRRGDVELKGVEISNEGEWKEPDFAEALGRALKLLNVDASLVADLIEAHVLSHKYVVDLIDEWQFGYLVKWGLVRAAPAGWAPTPKLIYLYGLYLRRRDTS